MAQNQTDAQKTVAATVNIQKPKEPRFDLARETSWLREEMLKTGKIAKEKLGRETKLHQKHLDRIYEPLRRQIGASPESEELTRESHEYVMAATQDLAELDIEQRMRNMIGNERRASLSPRVGSCVPAFAPYPSSYQDPSAIGGFGLVSHLDASIGQMGGFLTTYPIGGDVWLATGVGEWVYSGANSGTASVRVDTSVWGRCAEEAIGGYWRNMVKIHVRTWDADGQLYDAQQTIHDNWEVIGLSIRDFNGDSFSPTMFVPIQAYRWYLIWAWAEQYTASTPINAGGGSNLWIYASRLEICV